MRRLRYALAMAWLSSVACTGAGERAAGVATTVDTVGGVARVHNAGSPPRWSLDWLFTIGSLEGPAAFGRIVSLLADDDGRIYVADAQSNRIMVFDAAGRLVDSIGRPGRGPGEFRWLYSLAWLGDTLAVLDPGNARIGLLYHGEWAGEWRHQPVTGETDFIKLYRAPDTTFAAYTIRSGPDRSGSSFVRFSRTGPGDTVMAPPTPDRLTAQIAAALFTCDGGDRGIGFFGTPFATTRSQAFNTTAMLVGWSDEYRLAFIGPKGDTVRLVDYDRAPPPISDHEWDSSMTRFREWRKDWSGAECKPGGEPERPAAKPFFRALWVDPDQRVWVEAYAADGFTFDVFDANGRLLGTMLAPRRAKSVTPYARGDRLYLVTSDSLGVQYVRVFRIDEEGDR